MQIFGAVGLSGSSDHKHVRPRKIFGETHNRPTKFGGLRWTASVKRSYYCSTKFSEVKLSFLFCFVLSVFFIGQEVNNNVAIFVNKFTF